MKDLARAKVALSEAEAALEAQLDKDHVSDEYRLSAELRLAEVTAQVAQAEALEQIATSLSAVERYVKYKLGEGAGQ